MRRYLRYLRIAFSVTCGIACVLLVVLWVRSYWVADTVRIPSLGPIGVSSAHGLLLVGGPRGDMQPSGWGFISASTIEVTRDLFDFENAGFKYFRDRLGWVLQFPHWFAVAILCTLAALPWIRWRFSLRTLLIATTVVALALGLIIYATRG